MTTELFLDGSTCPPRLVVSGVLDLLNVAGVQEQLAWLSTANRPVHLDLSDVGFLDGSAVAMLVRASRTASGDGVRIVAASAVVRRVLHLCDAGWLLDPPGSPRPFAGVIDRRVGSARRGADIGPATLSFRPRAVDPAG